MSNNTDDTEDPYDDLTLEDDDDTTTQRARNVDTDPHIDDYQPTIYPPLDNNPTPSADPRGHVRYSTAPAPQAPASVAQPVTQDTFLCPKCHQPQTYFINRGRGWVRCPTCNKGIKSTEVPKPLISDEDSGPDPDPLNQQMLELRPNDTVFPDQRYDSSNLFNEPKEPWQILDTILKFYSVPVKQASIIVRRCQALGQMHPIDVGKMVSDLIGKGKVAQYIADDYQIALNNQEQNNNQQYGPSNIYMPTYNDPQTSRFYGQTTRRPLGDPYGMPPVDPNMPIWKRQQIQQANTPAGGRPLTEEEFERRWTERERAQQQQNQISQLTNEINGLKQTIMNISNQQPQQSPTDKMLELLIRTNLSKPQGDPITEKMIEQLQETVRSQNELMKDFQQKTSQQQIETMKMINEKTEQYNRQLLDIMRTNQYDRPINTDAYKEDGVRLQAEALNNLSGIIKENKPLQTITKVVTAANNIKNPPPISENKVVRNKDRGILEMLPDELKDSS